MRSFAMTLAALVVAATAFAQDVFFVSYVDPITNENNSFLAFDTVDYRWSGQDGGAIVIACRPDGLLPYRIEVLTNDEMGYEPSPSGFLPLIPVVYRFDYRKPVSVDMFSFSGDPGDRFGHRFFWIAWYEDILAQLLSSSRFVFRVTRFDGNRRTLVFDIPSDLREYVDRLGCAALD